MNGELRNIAVSVGAHDALVIPCSSLELNPAFRDLCEANTCGKFDACWVCPPHLPSAETAIKELKSYDLALWYQSVHALEDSFDIEGMQAAARNHAQLSQRIDQALEGRFPRGHLHLSCGGCHLCESCAKLDDEACRNPRRALPSLEGFCVDVYQTTAATRMRYSAGPNTVTYFGAYLLRS